MAARDEDALALSIGAVSRATGIPANTLRTWERRYGFPRPVRTDGGQRLYEASVVPHLEDVVRALDRGLRPREVLAASREEVRRWGEPDPGARALDAPDDLEPLLDAVRALDGDTLVRTLQLLWAREGGVAFLDGVAGPFLARVGQGWANGELGVFQEHFAAEVLRTMLLGVWRPLATHARGPAVVCATTPGERHDLGLHLVAAALSLSGRRIAFLGADVPLGDIARAALQAHAEAVALSFSSGADARTSAEHIAGLRELLPRRILVIIGGGGAPAVDLPGVLALRSCAELDAWAVVR